MIIFILLVWEFSIVVGEVGGDKSADGTEEEEDENDFGDDGGEEEAEEGGDGDGVVVAVVDETLSQVTCNFLLQIPVSCLPSFPSTPNMESFKRFTSSNLTGFTIKSSAPSSKQLFRNKKTNNRLD